MSELEEQSFASWLLCECQPSSAPSAKLLIHFNEEVITKKLAL